MVLVRVVDLSEAHLVTNNSISERWEKALVMFLESNEVSERIKEPKCKPPGWRSLQERFKLIVKKRCAHLKKQESASGVYEVYGEYKEFLDTLISSMDDKKDVQAKSKVDEEQKMAQLRKAGDKLHENAVKRMSSSEEDRIYVKTPRKKHKSESLDAFCASRSTVEEKIDLIRRRLEVDERRIALEDKHPETQEKQTEALVNVLLDIISKK